MTKIVLIVFSLLSVGSVYATYSGAAGLQEVVSETKQSVRSGSRSSSSGWSYGK